MTSKKISEELTQEDNAVLVAARLLNKNRSCPKTKRECFYAYRPFDKQPNLVQCWADPRKYAVNVLEKCPIQDKAKSE